MVAALQNEMFDLCGWIVLFLLQLYMKDPAGQGISICRGWQYHVLNLVALKNDHGSTSWKDIPCILLCSIIVRSSLRFRPPTSQCATIGNGSIGMVQVQNDRQRSGSIIRESEPFQESQFGHGGCTRIQVPTVQGLSVSRIQGQLTLGRNAISRRRRSLLL